MRTFGVPSFANNIFNLFRIPNTHYDQRNFGLDLLRTLAILLVVGAHGLGIVPHFKWRYLIFYVASFFGVEIFFVLSGYLIGYILIRRALQKQSVTWHDLQNFWIRRWFRTLPNYFLFLILNVFVYSFLLGSRNFSFSYLLFGQNLAWPIGQFMSESWSLAIEEWFYFTMPIILFLFSFRRNATSATIGMAIITYIMIFSALRFSVFTHLDLNWNNGLRTIVLARLDAIGYGVLLAWLHLSYPDRFTSMSKRFFIAGSLLICIEIILFIIGYATHFTNFFFRSVYFSIVNLSIAMIIPYMQQIKPSSFLIPRFFTHISIISYSMYLIHRSLVKLFVTSFLMTESPWQMQLITYIFMTMVISILIYKFFEKPMTDLRDRFSRTKSTSEGLSSRTI